MFWLPRSRRLVALRRYHFTSWLVLIPSGACPHYQSVRRKFLHHLVVLLKTARLTFTECAPKHALVSAVACA